ncbi:V-set and immunoglobulin domain-containing protein 10-like 2 isoform X2 [Hemicordylus capensis]|uniref:V-set and immunoglobulin domain-containing protein 10-like 2 isoform X2 n=1 Tax=Hemicordylus capensis TaxID=884348 RepID=UPI002302D100|nr:V-set and immunoglobulin domain-containing protein 10-like 2 isoform X2 [Hemicordylus capensis]
MGYGLARNLQFTSLLNIFYILPTVAYGQLLPVDDTKYEEQVVKGVRDRSVLLACGEVVLPMIVFWSFTKLGTLVPRAVAISNGLESKVEKSAVLLGDVSLRNSTLEIENLKLAAEGHFMCQAMYEEDGEIRVAYFYIELIVLVPVSKPFLQMNNSTPVEGMPVVMMCTVREGTPPVEYSWQRHTNRDGPVAIAEAIGALLNLTSANRTQMGWYTCMAQNEVNSQTSDKMYLDVIYGPDEPVISIEPFAINQHGFSANEQEEVTMTCLAPSNPPSHYIWFYNSSQVYAGPKYVITRISRTQTGTYTCLAQNTHLNTRTQTTIILTVYYLPKGKPSCVPLPAANFQKVALRCSWQGGFPPVLLRWVRSGQEGNHTATYSNATQVHQGMGIRNGSSYTCLASHPGLRDDAVCRTTVWIPRGSPTCSAVATKQNEFLMLTCDWAGGQPRVTLWWRDWRDHVLGGLKQSHNIFVMKSNTTLGGKEFTCMAAHPLHPRAAECHVRLEPPKLLVERSKMSLFEGNEVQLACHLLGAYLGSEVFWYNNRNQVIRADARKYRLQQENAWFNVTLRDTEWMKDSGVYRCAAMNAVGNASVSINLQVKKYPKPPNVTISKLMYSRHRTEVDLEWQIQGAGNLTGFVVQRREAKKAPKMQPISTWETAASDIDPDVRDQKLGGLDPTVVYAFRILAVNHRTTGHPSEVKTPVIGAAVAGMIVATVASLLVFQYIVRNRENNPRLHDLLFRMAGVEAHEHISTPEDAETAAGMEGEASEQPEEPSAPAGEMSSGAEGELQEATVAPEDSPEAQDAAAAAEPAPETTGADDPVNVTITVTATP